MKSLVEETKQGIPGPALFIILFIFILNINNKEWRQEDRETSSDSEDSETSSVTVMSLYCQACVHDCLYMTDRPSVGFI